MKITRDAFLYLSPKAPTDRFAQCSTCRDWVRGDNRCRIHGPRLPVKGTASCGLYVHGDPKPPDTPCWPYVTPEQSGLVDRQVRCENCAHMATDEDKCMLYDTLNKKLPDLFDLKVEIHPQGCCNAQTP
jgi:hypothetical protein